MGFWDVVDPLGIVDSITGKSASAGYDKAASEMMRQLERAAEYYKPYREAGERSLPEFEKWMGQYKDPKEFMRNVFADYKMSPGAQFGMEQAQRAANAAASASGLTGSTAHMREAGNIANQFSSRDMQQYLQNILGIGGNYGQSLNSLIGGGLNAAGGSAGLFGNTAGQLGQLYGQGAASRQNALNQLLAMGMNVMPFLL